MHNHSIPELVKVQVSPYLMKKINRKVLLIGLILLGTLFTSRVSNAQADSAATVINTINQLRAQRGLASLQSHPALMQIAQQHSQYQAASRHLQADL